MVSSNRNNQLCASFSVFRSLSLSLSLSFFASDVFYDASPRSSTALVQAFCFWIGLSRSFLSKRRRWMRNHPSVAREEECAAQNGKDNTTTRDDAARRIRRGTSGRRFSRPPRVVVGVVSGSLSLVFFCASEKRALSQTLKEGPWWQKPNCHHPKEKKKEEKNDFDDFDAAQRRRRRLDRRQR